MKKIEQNKIMCSKWFQSLRNLICKEIEALEGSSVKFKRKSGLEIRMVQKTWVVVK